MTTTKITVAFGKTDEPDNQHKGFIKLLIFMLAFIVYGIASWLSNPP
ncbi:MAG: hypothetical protein ACXW0G_00285 [Methylosarcina sp.]